MKLPVLIAGEFSGRFRRAFQAQGFDAWSCDLEPSQDGGQHIIGNWYDVIPSRRWQLIIVHPECTKVCVSGNHVYAKGKPKHHERIAAARQIEGLVRLCRNWSVRVVMENPRGVLGTMTALGKATDTVQPYEFGDNASKTTDLWLFGVSKLLRNPAQRVPGRWVTHNGKRVERWANQTDSGQNRLGPSETRGADRTVTYPGIAKAGAMQWGAEILKSVQVEMAA